MVAFPLSELPDMARGRGRHPALPRWRPFRCDHLPLRRRAVLVDGRRLRPRPNGAGPVTLAHRSRRRGAHAAGRFPEGQQVLSAPAQTRG
jgi:hypothetical protein